MTRVVHYLRKQGRAQVHQYTLPEYITLGIPVVLIARNRFFYSGDQASSWCDSSIFRGFQ